MGNNKDNKEPLYDYRIELDITNFPDELKEMIKELELYSEQGDWFNYDLLFDYLDIRAKGAMNEKQITREQYEKILNKYGWLYD